MPGVGEREAFLTGGLPSRRDDPMSRLTPRELQVLQLMAEGRSNT
jgi:DNA-binding CsgD family transcriptional regulator